MKTYRYTSDLWGSDPFESRTIESFQARVDELYRVGDWGESPEVFENDGSLMIHEGLDIVSVGDVTDEVTG